MLCLHLWLVFAPGDWHIFLATKMGNITLCGKLTLLLLTLKGASECEITDFPTRHRLSGITAKKKKKSQKHIHPEYQSQEIIYITL